MEMNPMRKNGPAEDAAEHSNTSNVRSDDDYNEDAIEEPKRATLPNAKRASMFATSAAPIPDIPFDTEEEDEVLCFTKYPTYNVSEFFGAKPSDRVGVPGAPTYDYKSIGTIVAFGGSSFQAVFTSPSFYFHLLLFGFFITFSGAFYLELDLAAMTFDSDALSTFRSLCIFTLVFFTGRVFTRYNERFHDCCRTNGGVTVVTAMCTGALSGSHAARCKAISIIRYTNAILHIYYMLISGGMDKKKWGMLRKIGVLTASEIKQLQAHGSPGVVVMSWAVRVLRTAVRENEMTDRMSYVVEEAMITVRGLAAKQIAYTICQIPLVYFHIMSMGVHIFLAVTSWDQAITFALRWKSDCTLRDDDGFPKDSEICNHRSGAVMVIIGQVLVIYLFFGLYMAAVWMSDPMGTQVSNYNMQVDLDNLWAESLNSIAAMLDHSNIMVPEISYNRKEQAFEVHEDRHVTYNKENHWHDGRKTETH